MFKWWSFFLSSLILFSGCSKIDAVLKTISLNKKVVICSAQPAELGLASDSTIDRCVQQCRSISETESCEIQLEDGTYNLTQPILLPSHTALSSKSGNRRAVILNRASPLMPGPVMGLHNVKNVRVKSLTINGQNQPPQRELENNINLQLKNCIDCDVSDIESTRSRWVSIRVHDAHNLTLQGNYIYHNGEDIDVTPYLPYRSDGISLVKLSGESLVANNTIENATDIHLMIAGGAKGRLRILNNVIKKNQLSKQATSNAVSGAGIGFDSLWGITPGCAVDDGDPNNNSDMHEPYPRTTCGDFSAIEFKGNVNACGSNCVYGLLIGTHANNNWGHAVQNLKIDSSNQTDRLTIDFAAATSKIEPTIAESCRYSKLTAGEALNTTLCNRPCEGRLYRDIFLNDPILYKSMGSPPYDGTLCDWKYDPL